MIEIRLDTDDMSWWFRLRVILLMILGGIIFLTPKSRDEEKCVEKALDDFEREHAYRGTVASK